MGHKEGISLEGISERRGHRHAFVYERVYEIIARDSDATGSTTFSKRSLAASLDCSLRSVDTAIQRLRNDGVIETVPQYGENGAQLANVYRLCHPLGSAPASR